jgi:RNA polymerase sigma-54 factor
MQKSLHILQLPVMELKSWLEEELSTNPAIEKIENDTSQDDEHFFSKKHSTIKQSTEIGHNPIDKVAASSSLFQHLMNQAPLFFTCKQDLWIAEQIVGNLDEKGFLTSLPECLVGIVPIDLIEATIKTLQQMDPPGICARSCRESLLIQLIIQKKENTLLYRVIKYFFKEFMEQKFSFLEKKLKIPHNTLIDTIKKDLRLLDPFPGLRFKQVHNAPIIPDIFVEKVNSQWKISINTKPLPKYSFSSHYQNSFDLMTLKDQKYLMKQYSAAKWIIRSIKKRNETLLKITTYLLKKQHVFFETDRNEILPLTIHEIAEDLALSESTITRALSEKNLACEKGMIALKNFFSPRASSLSEHKSIQSAKKTLRKLIQEENKNEPFSDEALVHQMKRQGFYCARRTITKYRKSLEIAPARIRKMK